MIRAAVLVSFAIGGIAISAAGTSGSARVSGGCAGTVMVTSDGGQRLGLEPSAVRLRRGECVRFENPTRAFVTVRIGAGYAVDLPPGTLTGAPGRADYQAPRAGVRVELVTDISSTSARASGSGTITVVAPASGAPSPTSSPPPLTSVTKVPDSVAPVAVSAHSGVPRRRASPAHRREHARDRAAGAPTPLPTVLPAQVPPPGPAHGVPEAASSSVSGATASARRTRWVGVAVLLIVGVASAWVRARALP